eukprot:12422998-Karenia_brevis.AAC.1
MAIQSSPLPQSLEQAFCFFDFTNATRSYLQCRGPFGWPQREWVRRGNSSRAIADYYVNAEFFEGSNFSICQHDAYQARWGVGFFEAQAHAAEDTNGASFGVGECVESKKERVAGCQGELGQTTGKNYHFGVLCTHCGVAVGRGKARFCSRPRAARALWGDIPTIGNSCCLI